MGYMRDVHFKLIEQTKQTMQQNQVMKTQTEAQENMIKDLVAQI